MIQFFGNSAYCYANSTSMMLYSIGEYISPSTIEILTGVGLGAFWLNESNLIMLSNLGTAPDRGISKALDLLGFEYIEKFSEDAEKDPFDELQKALTGSTALLGPLDMGYLSYIPAQTILTTRDHFVLAYKLEEGYVYLHDPEGYPHVSISTSQLKLAWRADVISYRRHHYRYWSCPKRISTPTDNQIREQALSYFKSCYLRSDDMSQQHNWIVGYQAILHFSNYLLDKDPSQYETAHMVEFVFRVGSKRALDYADYFYPFRNDLGVLKHRQAEILGQCHSLAMQKSWKNLSGTLKLLADTEDEFRSQILK